MLNEEMLLLALNDTDDALLERTRKALGYKLREKKRSAGKIVRIVLIAAVLSALLIGASGSGCVTKLANQVIVNLGIAAVSEAFVRETEGEEPAEEQYTYQGHVLDLTDAVRTSVLLEVPTRILCREDCKGLCDQCGANLNVTTCSCRKESLYRNPFQALAERMEEIIPTEDQEV